MRSSSPKTLQGARPEVARAPRRSGREVVGRFFVWTSGIHVGVAVAHPAIYRHFADAATLRWVERGWNDIFMTNPRFWGPAVAGGELTLGLLLLHGGRAAKAGWIGVIGFHIALVLFGWAFLFWSTPALAVLILLARRDWPRLTAPEPPDGPVA